MNWDICPFYRFKFIQGTWAGIDPLLNYIKPNVTPTVPICRFAHPIFSQLMAEYVVSQVINWERQFKDIHKWQDQKFWPPQMYMGRSLNDLQVGILGYGNMGKAVAKALQVWKFRILQAIFGPLHISGAILK